MLPRHPHSLSCCMSLICVVESPEKRLRAKRETRKAGGMAGPRERGERGWVALGSGLFSRANVPMAHCMLSLQVMSNLHFLSSHPHWWSMHFAARRPVPGFQPSLSWRRLCLPHHESCCHCFARHHVPQSSHSESSPDHDELFMWPPLCFTESPLGDPPWWPPWWP